MNARMPELKRCFERAGFTEVKTVLSSGNVIFSAAAASEAALERKAEAVMAKELGRAFYTIVRPINIVLSSRPEVWKIGLASASPTSASDTP